jgi:hypothetical protein
MAPSTGELFLTQSTTTHFSQRAVLKGEVLVFGTDARIAEEYGIVAKLSRKLWLVRWIFAATNA